MKLLAFVLLGFLAHSCSGYICRSHEDYQKSVCNEFDSHFKNNEGCKILPFNIPGITGIIATATGLVSFKTTLTYKNNGIYLLDIGGAVNLNCLQFTGLGLSVRVTAELGLLVTDECLNLILIEGSLRITIKVANQAVSVGLGGIVGGLTGTLISGFTDKVQLLLQAKIGEIIGTCLTTINTKYQATTSSVYRYNSWIAPIYTSIGFTENYFWTDVDFSFQKDGDTEPKRIPLGSSQPTDLVQGVISAIGISADFVADLVDCVLDDVLTTVEIILTNDQWQGYGVYKRITSGVSVKPKKKSAPSCSVKSTGTLVSLALGVELCDGNTGVPFLDIDVDVDIDIDITRDHGNLGCYPKKKSVSGRRVNYKGDGCGCNDDDDDSLIDIILDIVDDVIDAIFGDLECALSSGLPCSDLLPADSPPKSDCVPIEDKNEVQCTCKNT